MIKYCNLLIFKSIIYFFLQEIKVFVRHFRYLIVFFKYVSFFKYIIYRKKDYRILRNKTQRRVLEKNYHFWKRSIKKSTEKDKILITSLIEVVDYSIGNAIVGKILTKILNKNSIGLIKELHFKTEIFLRSFGIDEVYYIPEGNFFSRLKYFFKSIELINNIKNTDDLLKLKYQNVDIGIAVYDHHIRFTGIGSCELINPKMIYFLSKALLVQNFSKKLFKSKPIKEVVQTEQQFIPSMIIFQNALLNKCRVFARIGLNNEVSVLIKNGLEEKFTELYTFSQELLKLVYKNYDNNMSEKIDYLLKERFKGNITYSCDHDIAENMEHKFFDMGDLINNYTKEELCKKFNWNVDKPIVVIFSTDLTDGVFKFNWKIFKDNLTGLKKTLDIIKKIKDINWLIKSHPNDVKLEVVTSTEEEVLNLSKKYQNIRLFPKKFGCSPLPKIISAAITMSGSAGYEYPALGVPTIICTGAFYSGHGFNYEAHTINEYEKMLKNADKLIPLSIEQISKAKTFIYTHTILSKVISSLIPNQNRNVLGGNNFENNEYWRNFEMLIENYKFDKDEFYKNFNIQLEKYDRHTIKYKLLK